jgi:hypothetical protein
LSNPLFLHQKGTKWNNSISLDSAIFVPNLLSNIRTNQTKDIRDTRAQSDVGFTLRYALGGTGDGVILNGKSKKSFRINAEVLSYGR